MIQRTFFVFLMFFSTMAFSSNVIVEKTNNVAKEKIYSQIIESIENVNEISISQIKDIPDNLVIYVVGESIYNEIKSNKNFIDKKFVLLGVYLPPKDINLYENWKVVSLFISLDSILKFTSSYDRVFLTYKDENDWYYKELKDSKNFIFEKVNSKKEAIVYYRNVSKNIQKNDIFLLSPHNLFDKVTTSELLQLSWEKEFKTLSVLTSHSRKGFLIAPYFKKDSMSKTLKNLNYDVMKKISGINTDLFSINSRTAKHLRLKRSYIDNFEVVY